MKKVMTREELIERLRRELPYLSERFGVARLAIYGSFAHGTPRSESDVDLVVELSRPLGFEFVNLVDYLERALGRKVSVITAETVRRNLSHPRYCAVAEQIERTKVYV
ncbi:hypothetical protein DCOP10_11831 [Armatimonadetes bacterium DC]|nr:hypothetical protein DCOP10_11831 [Armatimonadetes bacterium DC]